MRRPDRTPCPRKDWYENGVLKAGIFKLRYDARASGINAATLIYTVMASFQQVQEALIYSLEQEIIDDEEFALLYNMYTPQNLPFPHCSYKKFSLRHKDLAECKADFRFDKHDIPTLIDALQMPPAFRCPNGTVCNATEGLCIVLKRFAYPCRLSDMVPIFGRSVP